VALLTTRDEYDTETAMSDPTPLTSGAPCMSCHGSGEYPTESGVMDCPDCGGSGQLPPKNVLVEWRARDIERAYEGAREAVSTDIRWLLAELRNTRTALTEIVALAHDISDDDAVAMRIRFVANRALGLHIKKSQRQG